MHGTKKHNANIENLSVKMYNQIMNWKTYASFEEKR